METMETSEPRSRFAAKRGMLDVSANMKASGTRNISRPQINWAYTASPLRGFANPSAQCTALVSTSRDEHE